LKDDETFRIRRAFVLPMGLLIILTMTLLVISVMQGQPLGKVIILAGLILPLLVLFVESACRRIVVTEADVKAFRPFRQRQMNFADVTSLESVRVRSRVFVTLVAGNDDFLIISNSYGRFPILLQHLVDSVPEGAVTDETQQMMKQPPLRQADDFTAWFAVMALVYILVAQFKT
jgi:hypothetical protein